MGTWCEKASIQGRARADTIENLYSQSTSINFSYIGSEKLFAQINCIPTIKTSLESNLLMNGLSRKG
jgi:hypothetical protein